MTTHGAPTAHAKIAALPKTLGTGITGELAAKLWPRLGTGLVAVVELIAEERSEDAAGEKTVKLAVASIEPATDEYSEALMRDLARALYRTRNPQAALTTPLEETVDDVTGRGRAWVRALDADADA